MKLLLVTLALALDRPSWLTWLCLCVSLALSGLTAPTKLLPRRRLAVEA